MTAPGSRRDRILDLFDHSYDLVVASLTKAQQDSLPPRP